MKIVERKKHAVVGITVEFTVSELLALGELRDDLAEGISDGTDDATENAIVFLNNLIGEVQTLEDARKELFKVESESESENESESEDKDEDVKLYDVVMKNNNDIVCAVSNHIGLEEFFKKSHMHLISEKELLFYIERRGYYDLPHYKIQLAK